MELVIVLVVLMPYARADPGAADAIEHIVVKDFTKCLVIRMRSVPALDFRPNISAAHESCRRNYHDFIIPADCFILALFVNHCVAHG